MISKFNLFVEKKLFTAAKTDSPTVSASMNYVNKLSNYIDEFNKKRVEISNIYATYTNELNLIKTLTSKKYCERTDSKAKLEFKNPLIKLWAQSADKRRELDDLNKQVKKIEDSIESDTANLESGATPQDLYNQNTDLNKSKIDNFTQKAKDLEKEIVALERKCKEQLAQMTKDLQFQKTRIDKYRLDKFKEFQSEEPKTT